MTPKRPDPDELLNKIQQEEAKQQRGCLKIFFGSCAGVGKTFAMLLAANAQRSQGIEVVVGVVETHGRSETAQLLAALEVLPPKLMNYRGKQLPEFDLDGALARKPSLILIDELAHSNVTGSRHLKRWQDVEELLTAGIHVYTTVNVQHLESLNDIVGQITGVRVWETLPDHVFEKADEVTLVDITPDELLQRLKEGKVYLPQQAQQAIQNFFRKGNLIALRELALRRTADRVDAQMRDYRADQAIQPIWQAKERLMVCLGPGAEGEQLVRSAARLAAGLRADWLVVYVETPALQRLPTQQRDQILTTLKLAQELGAETVSLSGTELADTLLSYARSRNVTKWVVGKSRRSWFAKLLRPSLMDELANRSQDIDVYIVIHTQTPATLSPPVQPRSFEFAENSAPPLQGYILAIVAGIGITFIAASLNRFLDAINVIMLYLLVVVGVTVQFGRSAGILASILSVILFDFFFVPPQLSLTIADTQYLFTFAVMLAVSLIISHLTASLRYQARVASYRERRTSALYALSKELSSALTVVQIIEISCEHLQGVFQAQIALLLPDSHEKVRQPLTDPPTQSLDSWVDIGIAQWVYDNQQPAGLGTHTLPANPGLYLPLRAPMRTRGVLAMVPTNLHQVFQPEQQRLLDTFAAQIALALERVHYVDIAQDVLVSMEAERLRNSVLAAISHDLRTPLTAIVGLSSTLNSHPELPIATRQELTETLYEEALRINSLVINLLDMARLQSGGLKLNLQWQFFEEVVGSTLRSSARLLAKHEIVTQLPSDLPLLLFDAILIERVLGNLLENAAKYTPPGSRITLAAQVKDTEFQCSVSDNGPGFPLGMEEKVFDKFTRGEKQPSQAGVGLGLAICRAIIEAHGGKITAKNNQPAGAKLTFTLPLRESPPLPAMESSDDSS
ncbi:MAG: sensor histidine kinase KdpD [Thioploca sp.]|nr:sensor histidine kinase KdpD [Thioploca sp.]